jgi:regulatory protein YycI of two-component signal transduction system YycFG
MKRTAIFILVFIVIGLVLGYFMFGRIAGEYVSIGTIFSNSDNALESFGRNISGLTEMKQNILISGGAGGVLGLILSLIGRK